MFEDKIVLTGVKPTGTPHLGNYLGAIKPALAMGKKAKEHYMFIADYHAINAEKDPAVLNQKLKEIACIYLACGLDTITLFFINNQIFMKSQRLQQFCMLTRPKAL